MLLLVLPYSVSYTHLDVYKRQHLMQDKEHTAMELDKMNRCKAFLKANRDFEKDSFVDLNKED